MKRKAMLILLSTLFLAAIYCPPAVWITKTNRGGVTGENRTLAPKPMFSLEEIEKYPQAYETYYNDHLPFRSDLIRLYNSLQYFVFHTSSNEKVIVGREGWLFYGNQSDGDAISCYDGSLLLTDEQLRLIAQNLTDARDKLKQIGSEFVLFIAPNKERVYSEFMPPRFGDPAEECMVNQVVDYLRENTDIKIVYPYQELIEQKESNPDVKLYYKTDTHWNYLGAYIGARKLLEELDIYYPELSQMEYFADGKGAGDLANMLNLSDALLEDDYNTEVRGYLFDDAVEIENNYHGIMAYNMPQLQHEKRKLFVRRDSFCTAMMPYLNSSFSESMFVHQHGYAPEQVYEYQPDIFVLETVERYLPDLVTPFF